MTYRRADTKTPTTAKKDYDGALLINPKDVKALVNRSGIKAAIKDYEGVIVDCNNAIEIDPKYVDAYINRGGAWHFKKDTKAALDDF